MAKTFILTLCVGVAAVLAAITPLDAQQSQTEPAATPATPALADIMMPSTPAANEATD